MNNEEIKKLIADDHLRIELHDRMGHNLNKLIEALDGEQLSNDTTYSLEEFKARIEKIEELAEELCTIQVLLAYWGTVKQSSLFTFSLNSITLALKGKRDRNIWRAVKWHSIQQLFYCGGISAVASGNYYKLYELFDLMIPPPDQTKDMVTISQALLIVNSKIDNVYNKLIENDNHITPLSEYLYNQINLIFNKVISLGPLYEPSFDRFELMRALDYIDRKHDDIPEQSWSPIGRFYLKTFENNPFHQILNEAEKHKENWAPLQAGFCHGSYERFQKICASFQKRLQQLRW